MVIHDLARNVLKWKVQGMRELQDRPVGIFDTVVCGERRMRRCDWIAAVRRLRDEQQPVADGEPDPRRSVGEIPVQGRHVLLCHHQRPDAEGG